jgi:hypothetical protein
MKALCPLLFLLVATACSGSTVSLGAFDGGAGGGGDGGVVPPSGPAYEVHLRASQSPVTFADGASGETPLDQRIGVRSLTLLRDANDPSPLVVFDHGADAVECGLNDGSDTIAGYALASALPADTFRLARVTIGFFRFKVAATMHSAGTATKGDYDDVEVLTANTSVNGQSYAQGHYSFTWEVGGQPYGTLSGEGLIFPVDLAGGGLTLVTTADLAYYEFAVNLKVDPSISNTVKVSLNVNTYENFRWEDQSGDGYASGVFDTTPTTYETVKSFGANSLTLSVE